MSSNESVNMYLFNKHLRRYKCAQVIGSTSKIRGKDESSPVYVLKGCHLVLKIPTHNCNYHNTVRV